MKKFIFIILLSFIALPAFSQITGNACTYVEEGGMTCYDSPTIMVDASYRPLLLNFVVRLEFSDGATTNPQGEFYMVVTRTAVDAKTGTGTGETNIWHNALLQVVKEYLEGITENAAVTFTII